MQGAGPGEYQDIGSVERCVHELRDLEPGDDLPGDVEHDDRRMGSDADRIAARGEDFDVPAVDRPLP